MAVLLNRLAHAPPQRIMRKAGAVVIRRDEPIQRIPDAGVHAVRERAAVGVVGHRCRAPLRELGVRIIHRYKMGST